MRGCVHPSDFECLCLLPNVVVDNAKMRNLFRLPLVLRIWPGDALASIGVLHHSDLVPNDPTNVEFVKEQTHPALCISIDGGAVPACSSRWRYPIAVEITSQVSWGSTGRICVKNAPNNFCLPFDDFKFARATQDRSIAIGPASGVTTITDNTSHTPPHFLGAILPLHLTDQSTNTDEDRIGDTVMNCLDFDTEKREPLVQTR